jgi:hypothetical protein
MPKSPEEKNIDECRKTVLMSARKRPNAALTGTISKKEPELSTSWLWRRPTMENFTYTPVVPLRRIAAEPFDLLTSTSKSEGSALNGFRYRPGPGSMVAVLHKNLERVVR